MISDLFRAKIDMQSFCLCDCFSDIDNPENFYLKTSFPAIKAIDFDPIFDRSETFGTVHIFH